MATHGSVSVATKAVFTMLRLVWRLRLVVAVVLLVLLLQHMYCQHRTFITPPEHEPTCPILPCGGSGA